MMFATLGRRIGQAVILLSFASTGASASDDDLTAAFIAVFGQPPPVERHVSQGIPDATGNGGQDVALSLTPQFLVQLADGHYGLIVNETTDTTRPGGAPNNAIAVAYLGKAEGAWSIEHVWFDVGGLGFNGNGKKEVETFGSAPLYFTTNRWCGSNSCSDTINVLVLGVDGPAAMGEIIGGAIYPIDFPDTSPYCGSTSYTAVIGPPSSPAGRFSVTYEGWTAPEGKRFPQRNFRRTADVVARGGRLETGLQTPDCMR